MTANRIPEGVLAPVATTFGVDGELDLDAYRANMEFYANSRLDGVVIMDRTANTRCSTPTRKCA